MGVGSGSGVGVDGPCADGRPDGDGDGAHNGGRGSPPTPSVGQAVNASLAGGLIAGTAGLPLAVAGLIAGTGGLPLGVAGLISRLRSPSAPRARWVSRCPRVQPGSSEGSRARASVIAAVPASSCPVDSSTQPRSTAGAAVEVMPRGYKSGKPTGASRRGASGSTPRCSRSTAPGRSPPWSWRRWERADPRPRLSAGGRAGSGPDAGRRAAGRAVLSR
jgi:hypothetical protein